jgi:hypothetical protein
LFFKQRKEKIFLAQRHGEHGEENKSFRYGFTRIRKNLEQMTQMTQLQKVVCRMIKKEFLPRRARKGTCLRASIAQAGESRVALRYTSLDLALLVPVGGIMERCMLAFWATWRLAVVSDNVRIIMNMAK